MGWCWPIGAHHGWIKSVQRWVTSRLGISKLDSMRTYRTWLMVHGPTVRTSLRDHRGVCQPVRYDLQNSFILCAGKELSSVSSPWGSNARTMLNQTFPASLTYTSDISWALFVRLLVVTDRFWSNPMFTFLLLFSDGWLGLSGLVWKRHTEVPVETDKIPLKRSR